MIRFLVFLTATISLPSICLAQSNLLDNATHFEFGTPVNDVVYDSSRDVLYASIPSSAGTPLGNSIATIDPSTGSVLDSIFVGSEPNTLGISDDGSHVFVGIDGARSVRSWQPGSNSLSALVSLNASFSQAVAHDFAVVPGQPSVAVVSADGVGSTANGDLVLFDGSVTTPLNNGFNDANYIGFTNPTTLVGFDDSNTGFQASRFERTAATLFSLEDSQNGVVGGFNVEAEVGSDGLFYFTDGTVVDPETLNSLGRFNTGLSSINQLVEPVPSLGLNYFVGSTASFGGDVVLAAHDLNTFLEIDSVVLPVSSNLVESRGELIAAGDDRLAFVWKPAQFDGPGGSGVLNIVSGVPVSVAVPEPSTLPLLVIFAVGAFRRNRATE